MDPNIKDLERKVAEAAKLLTMLSHPARLKLLCILLEGEKSVLVLAAMVNLSQPAMSHHLKRLREAGFVSTRREAQTIYYSLKGTEVTAVIQTLHDIYCRD